MDYGQLVKLLLSTDVLGALLAALLIWLFGVPSKAFAYVRGALRRSRISKYVSASSFDDAAMLDSLKFYVRPRYMNVDPANEDELSDACINARDDLLTMVDRFIYKTNKKYLFVFADSGMGKTSFLIKYFYENYRRIFSRNREMVLISLARANAMDEILAVPLEKRKSTVLLLDALDEDPLVFNDPAARLKDLMSKASSFRAVVITCRSQFFLSDDVIPIKTGLANTAPAKASLSKEHEFNKVYLAPFDDEQIDKYLRYVYPGLFNLGARKRARRLIEKVPSLSVRPMLLAHISDILSVNENAMQQIDIYQAMVAAWVKREDRWVDPKSLLDFSEKLAFDLYLNRTRRGGELCTPAEIASLAETWGIKIKAEHLTGRALLNRTSSGFYKFAHRSILEFFVSESLFEATSDMDVDLTDQIARFLLQKLGCSTEKTEALIAQNPVRFKSVPPELRLGYSTNYGLYRRSTLDIDPIIMLALPVSGDSNRLDNQTLGDWLNKAIKFSVNSGALQEVVLRMPACEDGGDAQAFLALWFDKCVTLSRIHVDANAIRHACSLSDDDVGELCLRASYQPPGFTVEALSWERYVKVDIWSGQADVTRKLEETRIASIFYSPNDRNVTITVIRGGGREGPLADFGITKAGSSMLLGKRPFVTLPATSS